MQLNRSSSSTSDVQVVVFDGVQRLSVLGEYKNELEALVANELMSPAQPLSQLSDKEMQVHCWACCCCCETSATCPMF